MRADYRVVRADPHAAGRYPSAHGGGAEALSAAVVTDDHGRGDAEPHQEVGYAVGEGAARVALHLPRKQTPEGRLGVVVEVGVGPRIRPIEGHAGIHYGQPLRESRQLIGRGRRQAPEGFYQRLLFRVELHIPHPNSI